MAYHPVLVVEAGSKIGDRSGSLTGKSYHHGSERAGKVPADVSRIVPKRLLHPLKGTDESPGVGHGEPCYRSSSPAPGDTVRIFQKTEKFNQTARVRHHGANCLGSPEL